MFKEKKQWILKSEERVTTIEQLQNVLLQNRHVPMEEANSFIEGELPLHSPFLFQDMEKAVKRIRLAIERQENVVIYGDYDVDGVTATTILIRTLRRLGLEPDYYIPNRFTEGYGPNKEAFRYFIEAGVSLVITVDNGISGIEEAQLLKDHGVDLIITDHHEAKETLPDCYAIIHPNIPGETYPFPHLSGCGVAYKLACALLETDDETLIDLAALGTYADIVSVLGENRTILKRGLERLMVTSHAGLIALRQVAKVEAINEHALGFIYGPRLNAPGRMDHAKLAVELLITDDLEEAHHLAEKIEQINQERKDVIEKTHLEARQVIEDERLDTDSVLVVYRDHWHEGILGIVASRLVENYGKPAIVLTKCDAGYKGSARTLESFPLFENLEKVKEYLVTFGGHKMAAGLTVQQDKIEDFRLAINQLTKEEVTPVQEVECELDPSLISNVVIMLQEQLRPYGADNEQPCYLFRDVGVVEVRQFGVAGKHLRLQVQINQQTYTCIGFNFGYMAPQLTDQDTIDLVAKLRLNDYMDTTTIQLQIVDLRCQHVQLYDYRTKYFTPEYFEGLNFQAIYFHHNYDFPEAQSIEDVEQFRDHILLVDLPERISDLRKVTTLPHLSKLLVLFRSDSLFGEELLLRREHFVKSYAVYRQFKHFSVDDPKLIRILQRAKITKNMHKLALQVFLELKFVIIKGKSVSVVVNPEKRELSESPTYQRIQDKIKLKEILTLSSTNELKDFLFDHNKQ